MSVGQRSHRIELMRGVSILLVLLNHFNIAYNLNDTSLADVGGWNLIRALARNGNYGVTMFFVISGYLITTNAQRRWPSLGAIDAKRFYRLRVARIVPCLLLLLVVVNMLAFAGVSVFQNHAPNGVAVSLWVVDLASLTFWMNVLIGLYGWVNYPLGVLWSLAVEEVFYLTFPILCLVLRSPARLIAFWCAVIVAGPIWRLLHQGDEAGYLYAYFASFDGIAIGCCTAILAARFTPPARAAMVVRALAIMGMMALYLIGPIRETNILGVTAMAAGMAAILLMDRVPTEHPPSRTGWAGGTACWLGKHSYELYIFHLIVLGLFRTVLPRTNVVTDWKLVLFAAFLVASSVVSAAVARFYAEPLNRQLRGLPAT